MDLVENFFHSFENSITRRVCVHTSRSLFFVNKHQSECTRDAGVRVEREKEIQFPNKHEAHFPIVYPVPSPICSLFSGRRLKVPPRCMHACTERKVVWKDAKNGAVKSRGGRPSFRLLVLLSGLSSVFHPPSPLSTFLFFRLLFFFSFLFPPRRYRV